MHPFIAIENVEMVMIEVGVIAAFIIICAIFEFFFVD